MLKTFDLDEYLKKLNVPLPETQRFQNLVDTLTYFKSSVGNKEIINWDNIGNSKPNDIPIYDIFFSGQQSSEYRNDLIEFLKSKDYNFFGRIENSKISFEQYLTTIYNSSINLALFSLVIVLKGVAID